MRERFLNPEIIPRKLVEPSGFEVLGELFPFQEWSETMVDLGMKATFNAHINY